MNKSVLKITKALRRPAFLAVAAVMISVGLLTIPKAHAGQVQYRAIRMSDNGASGGTITSGVGSGTNVTYRVFFKAASSYTIKGVVVDFCDGTNGTPFIGDSNCSNPTNFSVGATPTIDTTDYTDAGSTNVSGLGSGWTATSDNSGQTFKMSNTTGTALTAGTIYTFAITGVTNPSYATGTSGTFYARLMTYNTSSGNSSYAHNNAGSYQDYGGFALSTAQIVQVTAKVQETLTFCVSGYSQAAFTANAATAPGTPPTSCSDTTSPAITLGHGTNNTLDTSAVDTNTVWTIASTNALHGVAIRMHNSNACGGLSTDGGTTCDIPAVSSGSTTPAKITAGSAAFGMLCTAVTGGGTTPLTCDSRYNDGTHVGPETPPIAGDTAGYYGMDTTSVSDNVTAAFGGIVASSTSPVNAKTNQYVFAATASNTTPAGIYKANLAMIATGTF